MRHYGGPHIQVDESRMQASSLRETHADRSFPDRVPGKARLQQTTGQGLVSVNSVSPMYYMYYRVGD